MSTITLKSRSAPRTTGLGHVGLPQVNLLPPEVRAARALRHVKQWLAVSLLIVLACLALFYAFTVMSKSAATKEFNAAQADQAKLQEEAKGYAPVQPILSGLEQTKSARTQLMGPEIVWKQYVEAIAAVLPPDAVISSLNIATAGATSGSAVAPSTGIDAPGIASVTFSATVSGLPDSAAWIDALNSIPGFYGASTSADTLEETDGKTGYAVSTTVQVNSTAFANRFAETPGATTDGN